MMLKLKIEYHNRQFVSQCVSSIFASRVALRSVAPQITDEAKEARSSLNDAAPSSIQFAYPSARSG